MSDEQRTQPMTPKWWQFLICPVVIVWGSTAWIGAFIFHNGFSFLLMFLFAIFGSLLSISIMARNAWRGWHDPRP